MLRKIYLFIILFAVTHLYGQQDSLQKKEFPFCFEGAYIGDAYVNTMGGLKTGAGYMGMGNLKVGFDTEKAGWWKGGSFFINGASIHGKSLSENFTGDLQVVSNIDAGTYTCLHELWFRQEFSKFSFTVGLQDLNAEFMVSENGAEFINSSFGVPATISCNVPVPIFPLTGLGITAKWDINEIFSWQAAVFDGCQKSFEHNPHNLTWHFGKDDGVLAITEFHAKTNIKLDGVYKIGGFYHSGFKELNEESQSMEYVFHNNYGFYALIDQTVMNNEAKNKKIGLFAQLAFSPKDKNEHAYYLGLGANYFGIFSKEGKDILGLALAHVGIHQTNHKHETALELYYKWQFNDNFAIQPDVQYIINPSGTGEPLKNALACMLRLHVSF